MMETSPWDGHTDRGEVSVLPRRAQAPAVMSDRNCWGGRRSRSRVGLPLLELPTSHPAETRGQCQRVPGPQLRQDAGCLTLSGRSERDQPSLAQRGTHSPDSAPDPDEAMVLGWEMLPGGVSGRGRGPCRHFRQQGLRNPCRNPPIARPLTGPQLPRSPR